jgi:hypothetical protein
MLIHTLGLIIFAGGQVWIGFTMAIAFTSKKPHGKEFALEFVEPMHKLMFTGFILLAVGGLIRMFADNLFSIFADFETLWGTAFFIKISLYIVLVISGLILARKFTPYVIKNAPKLGEEPTKEYSKVLDKMMKVGRTDFLLTMLIIVLSVVAITQ